MMLVASNKTGKKVKDKKKKRKKNLAETQSISRYKLPTNRFVAFLIKVTIWEYF